MATMPTIVSTDILPPPEWALLQRRLFSILETAGDVATAGYARSDGRVYHFFDVDDAYESRSMRAMLYASGRPRALPPHRQAGMGCDHVALQRRAPTDRRRA